MKMTEQYKLGLRIFPIEKGDKAIIIERNGKWGFFVIHNCKFIKPKYDSVRNFSDGRARIWLNSKFGFIDYNGKKIIPFKYDNVWVFKDGRARVLLNDKAGYVDLYGNETWDY